MKSSRWRSVGKSVSGRKTAVSSLGLGMKLPDAAPSAGGLATLRNVTSVPSCVPQKKNGRSATKVTSTPSFLMTLNRSTSIAATRPPGVFSLRFVLGRRGWPRRG